MVWASFDTNATHCSPAAMCTDHPCILGLSLTIYSDVHDDETLDVCGNGCYISQVDMHALHFEDNMMPSRSERHLFAHNDTYCRSVSTYCSSHLDEKIYHDDVDLCLKHSNRTNTSHRIWSDTHVKNVQAKLVRAKVLGYPSGVQLTDNTAKRMHAMMEKRYRAQAKTKTLVRPKAV